MSKNEKNNKVKLSATDVALLCGMVHLDYVKMAKYEKKILKNNPSLNETMTLIGKDTKAYLALMIGYHIAKIEKINKKKKKAVAKSRKSGKKCQAKDEFYWQTETNRNFAGNTDGLFDMELPPLGILPTDNNDKTVAAVNTTANTEEPQDMSVNTEIEDDDTNFAQHIKPDDIIGFANVNHVYAADANTTVVGCFVYSGKIMVNAKVQISRNGRVIHEGVITKIRRFKDEVDEVSNGFDCGVIIENYNGIMNGDIITCFRSEDNKPDNSYNEDTNDDQPIVPMFVNGDYFKILVTDVDTDNNTLTYLNLGEYRDTTPARVPSALSAIGPISEEDHCKLAENFGLDPEWVATGIDYIRTELPTKEQIETLKEAKLPQCVAVINKALHDNAIIVDDGTEEGKHKSRTALMPNGKLAKRQSNWHVTLIPSVTIEF